MQDRLRGSFTYANVMATVAVFIALGGGAYAAVGLGKGAVKTANLANGAVSSAKLKAGSVTTSKLAKGAVSAAQVANGAVAASQLADGSVTASKLASGAVTGAAVQPGSLTSSDFAAGQISSSPTGAAGGGLTGTYPNPTVKVTLPPAASLNYDLGWSGSPTDGEPGATCYEDSDGIVHFNGAIHSATAGAMTVMATLPSACPAPPTAFVVQLLGDLGSSGSTTFEYFPVTITAAGALVNPAGIAGNATDGNDNITLTGLTYRAR